MRLTTRFVMISATPRASKTLCCLQYRKTLEVDMRTTDIKYNIPDNEAHGSTT